MPKQLVDLLHLSLLDLVTSGEFETTFLTRRSLLYLLPPLIMVPNSFPIFHLVLNRDLDLRISPPKWFLVQYTILMHPKPPASTEFQPLSLKCVLQRLLLFLLSYTINAWPNPVFLPVGNLHRFCQFLKMMESSDPGK